MSSRPMLFGKYCLLERISVGGMAEVFRAKPLNAPGSREKYLALKRILPHLAEDQEFLTMFVDEAKLCVHLRHPNIVHIYELGRFQTSSYILMEFIPGQDLLALQKRLRKRRLIMSVAQACYIAMELAKGLDYAHKATDDYGRPLGIIHRDISPQNVLINYGGGVKLIDFGVAKAAIQSTKTQVGVLKGKFGYMSPEQIRGEGSIDHRSDIFAVGTVLWELLTNRRLFKGDNEFEVFQKVRDARVDPPSSKNPQIPPEVDRIVMKALTQSPDDRYAQASDMARDLGLFLTSIQPLYTQQMLSDWMRDFFAEEFHAEREKSARFSQIRTTHDVQRAFQASGSPEHAPTTPDEPEADATQIWDAEIAPDQGEDIESFAAAHTTVAAGGFDLEEFMSLGDDDILSSQEDAHAAPMQSLEPAPSAFDTRALRSSVATQNHQAVGGFSTHVDGSGTQPRGKVTANLLAQARKRRNGRALVAAMLVVCCAGLLLTSVALFVTSSDANSAEGPASGQGEKAPDVVARAPVQGGVLLITSTPSEGVEISLDGQKQQGSGTPLKIEDVAAGTHRIEVSREGYRSAEQSVSLEEGKIVPVDIVLEKQAAPQEEPSSPPAGQDEAP